MKIPASTYRIQLHKGFNLENLKNILDYLKDLGISTIYAAPVFSATPGSMHGYDVTDPHQINPETGTLDDLKKIVRQLKEKNMSWLQDIVPNHMAFNTFNIRLMDVLERGSNSAYYQYFDIDWNHSSAALKGKVMVPFLGKALGDCIADSEINLSCSDEGLTIDYYDSHYPMSIPAYEALANLPGIKEDEHMQEHLLEYIEQSRLLRDLQEWSTFKMKWIQRLKKNKFDNILLKILADINQNKDRLTEFLGLQLYVLSFWKRTEKEINYRRFFTVNSLICLRQEDEAVFNEYHSFLYSLYKDNVIQGVRIDHIDGLHNPNEYIERLRALFGKDCYIVAEKILEEKELIPEYWDIQGASGYQFLSQVSQLFTNRQGAKKLLSFYKSLVPHLPPYPELVHQNKKMILESYMAGEWENLTTLFFSLNLQKSFDREKIKQALSIVMLSLPVYRIYPRQIPVKGTNQEFMKETFDKAMERAGDCAEEVNYLHSLFMTAPENEDQHDRILQFLNRMMQFTGPLTAKGVEDTTFYVYNPLISHVEVGDAPSTLGITVAEFHKRMIQRQAHVPLTLNATATHDTKRGEDARMRLNVLSEISDLWEEKVNEWRTLNKSHHQRQGERLIPETNDEYFIYQSIVGGFPEDLVASDDFIERLQEYMTKVVREAKVNSNWESPDQVYEEGCNAFIEGILHENSAFLKSALPLIRIVRDRGNLYSLCQTLIKITAPGIPDTYQGCELWDLSFVDPDNRRPVDYTLRMKYLAEIKDHEKKGRALLLPFLKENRSKGMEKLYVTYKVLNFRRDNNDLFLNGDYLPLEVTGPDTLAVAYARAYHDKWMVVVVPVNISESTSHPDIWKKYNVLLPENAPKKWVNVFTGDDINVSDTMELQKLFSAFPVAMLSSN